MTIQIIREAGDLKDTIYSCDEPNCGAHFSADDIILAGGLKNMGWTTVHRTGQQIKHYCSTHARSE